MLDLAGWYVSAGLIAVAADWESYMAERKAKEAELGRELSGRNSRTGVRTSPKLDLPMEGLLSPAGYEDLPPRGFYASPALRD